MEKRNLESGAHPAMGRQVSQDSGRGLRGHACLCEGKRQNVSRDKEKGTFKGPPLNAKVTSKS